jgi:menaquinone-dependent protoporphyrinogen IX oxidase
LAFSSIKVKLRNSLNSAYAENLATELKDLKLSLVNSVPRHQHEAILSEFQQKNQKALTVLTSQSGALDILQHQVMTETEQEVRSLLEEIQRLQGQIKLLQQPFNFNPATRYDHIMANVIINYFWRMGVVLDRAHTDYKGWESIVYFHTDRSLRSMVASELNDHSDRLQPLLKCLNVPKFEWDGELGLMKVRLQVMNKPKEIPTQQDISKIWKPATRFEELVKGWRRVRVTGGSGSGKSPTAENLAIAILKHHPGQVKLANPMHVSVKNHWSIPVTWTSHDGSCDGIKELANRVENRAQGQESQDEFILYIFDEIDTTMTEHREIVSILMSAFKQTSHQNLGIISTGQNANASNYKGSDRSDWNNAVNVHIGSNAYDAITNSNSINSTEANRLKEQADKLTTYCEVKNAELGLLEDDPRALRFAIVMEPGKRPYFIELPEFGTYTCRSQC